MTQPQTLELRGEVGGPTFNHRQVVEHLRHAGPVALRIASWGGNADHGHAVFQSLKAHAHPVTAEIEFAGSAATIAAMGAGHRTMHAGGHFFVHGYWQATVGNAATLARLAARLAELDTLAVELYASATGQRPEVIRALLAEETLLTADKALELGFVHELVPGEVEPAPAFSWTRTALAVATWPLARQADAPGTRALHAEAEYHAVMSGALPPRPANPAVGAAELAEVHRRHAELFQRTQRSLLRSLATGAPYRPVAPYWRCECGARNYSQPTVAGRLSICHHCGGTL